MSTFAPAKAVSPFDAAIAKASDALASACNTELRCISTGDCFFGWVEVDEIALLSDAGPDEVIACTLCIQPCNLPKLGLPVGRKFTDGKTTYRIEKRRADKYGCHRYRLSTCKSC